MKTLTLALALAGAPALAQSFLFNVNNGFIPDASGAGLADIRTVETTTLSIDTLEVRVNLSGVGSGAYNGDLYLSLQHDSGFAVLLNRSGRTTEDPFGAWDNGFNVTFALADTLGDVHNYRSVLELGNDDVLSPLTGRWQADGRNVDPSVVLDSSARTAGLESFHGVNPNGEWTLFVADLSSGGLAQIQSWELVIEPLAVIPEPSTTAALAGAALAAFAVWRKRRSGLKG